MPRRHCRNHFRIDLRLSCHHWILNLRTCSQRCLERGIIHRGQWQWRNTSGSDCNVNRHFRFNGNPPPGTFASGNSSLTYSISGTPSSHGTANFALNIGGQTCTFALPVFQCGVSTVTFTYKGSSVTHGTLVGANNKCWLDRNLGASQVALSATDAAGHGDLFQWGRGDDNHQNINSGLISVLSSAENARNGSFILISSTPYDWRSPQNDALWQGVIGVDNPCPSGYRLPTESELNTERNSWSSKSASGAFGSPLKLTKAGVRGNYSGSIGNVNSVGGYWSSTTNGSFSKYLYTSDANDALVNISDRAVGYSVRCIKN